jgi:hypothetical protein
LVTRVSGILAAVTFLATAAAGASPGAAQAQSEMGRYFAKKAYQPGPLPTFGEMRDRLPEPVYDSRPDWIALYWKAWELAFRNFYEPSPGSGLVSQFIDAAFNKNIFLWDTAFMTMFCNYGHPLVPGIGSLDNFYARQHPDGEICREIVRATGADFPPWQNSEGAPLFSRWGYRALSPLPARGTPIRYMNRAAPEPNPRLTLDALDHPILAWAELESYRISGDRRRLEQVWDPLRHYFEALDTYLRQGNGLYMTDWASMDNSPRNAWLEGGGCGIDISAEMVLFARNLARIARMLGKPDEAHRFEHKADSIAREINRRMWDGRQGFYFDLNVQGRRSSIRTIAAYWALLAKVASSRQAAALVRELGNQRTFGRKNSVPTCSGSEPEFDPKGGYWRGAVWAPTTTMVVRGLENYGYEDRARQLALNHLELVAEVFKATGTIWENYAPDSPRPGKPAKKDFVGWSGIAPILYLLEYGIGLKPDAERNELEWRIPAASRVGCRRFRFNGHVASLIAKPDNQSRRMRVHVESDSEFLLKVQRGAERKTVGIKPGAQDFIVGK